MVAPHPGSAGHMASSPLRHDAQGEDTSGDDVEMAILNSDDVEANEAGLPPPTPRSVVLVFWITVNLLATIGIVS